MREESSTGVVLTVTASANVATRNCIVTSVSLNPAAAGCSVSLYDPAPFVTSPGVTPTLTTVGATLRITLVAPASVSSVSHALNSGVEFANGCVAVVTGAGATANIGFAVI